MSTNAAERQYAARISSTDGLTGPALANAVRGITRWVARYEGYELPADFVGRTSYGQDDLARQYVARVVDAVIVHRTGGRDRAAVTALTDAASTPVAR